jgi:hypothetical protein
VSLSKLTIFNILTIPKNVADEAGTYEAGATGNENFHCRLKIEAEVRIASCGSSSSLPACWLATRMFALNRESNVPASDHHPSMISAVI